MRKTAREDERTGVELVWGPGWAPWLDTSYLSEAERADPQIAANLRAIEDVCGLIAFVAQTEDAEYIGYWRGPQHRAITDSPLVILDNEGQFRICAGRTLAEAMLSIAGEFDEVRDWLRSLGITLSWSREDDMVWPEEANDPATMHRRLYDRYVVEGSEST